MPHDGSKATILRATVLLAGAVLMVLVAFALLLVRARPPAAALPASPPQAGSPVAGLADCPRAAAGTERVSLARTTLGRQPVHESYSTLVEDVGPVAPQSERLRVATLLALERAQPGALEARAQETLGGTGSTAEKAGFLLALSKCSTQSAVRWLEQCARGSEPLADLSLRLLTQRAGGDETARAALRRLAFEDPASASDVRRRAAAAFAALALDVELESLVPYMLAETDARLLAGVRSTLELRRESVPGRRVLALIPVDAAGRDPLEHQAPE